MKEFPVMRPPQPQGSGLRVSWCTALGLALLVRKAGGPASLWAELGAAPPAASASVFLPPSLLSSFSIQHPAGRALSGQGCGGGGLMGRPAHVPTKPWVWEMEGRVCLMGRLPEGPREPTDVPRFRSGTRHKLRTYSLSSMSMPVGAFMIKKLQIDWVEGRLLSLVFQSHQGWGWGGLWTSLLGPERWVNSACCAPSSTLTRQVLGE